MSGNILVVDDDKEIVQAIAINLEQEGFRVFKAYDGLEALEIAMSQDLQLIIIDVMMPKLDGLSAVLKIRERKNFPIMILSAKSEDTDKVLGLSMGADDYLTKPFRLTTLLMRVKSLLRRMDMNTKKVTGQELSDIKIGNLIFSAQENCLYCKGKPVSLSKTELKMLTYMLKEPKKAFSREEILEGVWGFDTEVETRVTDETLRRIRRKLSLAGSNVSIGTIWGFGYRISIAEDKK